MMKAQRFETKLSEFSPDLCSIRPTGFKERYIASNRRLIDEVSDDTEQTLPARVVQPYWMFCPKFPTSTLQG